MLDQGIHLQRYGHGAADLGRSAATGGCCTLIGATIGLIPWIAYLSLTLPEKYVAHNWTATWVGFDVLLLVFLAITALLGLLRRQLLIVSAFTTGVLLVCDAWFDVMTAAPGDRWPSVLTAVVGESRCCRDGFGVS